MPAEVVQYVVAAIDDERTAARERAKATVGGMLVAYCHEGRASAATQSAVRDYNGLAREDFDRLVQRLARGEAPASVIDDGLLDAYAVAGTVSECLERSEAYGDVGATELGLWFTGDHPLRDIARLGQAL